MVGPHVTDLVEAGVVALDAESTVETVADGMAPHPTLSEAIKEAGLVALGRPIHVPAVRTAAQAVASGCPKGEDDEHRQQAERDRRVARDQSWEAGRTTEGAGCGA